MSKQDMRPTPPEEHYTVDEILEEFGSGAPTEEPSPIPDPAPEPQPEPESEPKAEPEPVSEPEYRPDDTPPPPGRIPWTSCAAGYRPGRRTPTSLAWSRRRTRTPFCRNGRL